MDPSFRRPTSLKSKQARQAFGALVLTIPKGVYSSRVNHDVRKKLVVNLKTTLGNGSLGSRIDEERSKVR